jgi:ribosomal protein L14|uniref:Ribosomal protein L14 n=2 Tax=Eutreptiella gymnastica TaxID=73025 RepID=A0A7S4CKY3_9EUGL
MPGRLSRNRLVRKGVGVCLEAKLRNQDNSGAYCIKNIGMFHRKKTRTAQPFTTSIYSVVKQPRGQAAPAPGGAGKVQKGQIRHAVMLTMRAITNRWSGMTVQFGKNTAALVNLENGKNLPVGTQIKGPIALEVAKMRHWQKVLDVQTPSGLLR